MTPTTATPIEARLVDHGTLGVPQLALRQQLSHARAWHAGVLAAAVVVLLAACLLEVQGGSHVAFFGWQLPELCWWRRMLGWNCPGCGLTRSLVSTMHAQWAAAWQYHMAGLPLSLAIAAQLPYRGWQLMRIARQGSNLHGTS